MAEVQQTLASGLIGLLVPYLTQMEELENETEMSISARRGIGRLVEDSMWLHTRLIITGIGTDPTGWGEVAEFSKTAQPSFRCRQVSHCLKVLESISGLFASRC